jgi:multiple sugar transport system permease protein
VSPEPAAPRADAARRARARRSAGWGTGGRTLVALVLAFPFLVPLVWMLSTSLKSGQAIFTNVLGWLPTSFHFSNYAAALSAFPFWHELWNTIQIAVPSAIGTVVSCSLAAYGFSHIRWRGRDSLFTVVLAIMMVPTWTTFIPLYVIFVRLHWVNTFLPLVLPNFLGTSSFSIFLLRQFFRRQPAALIEAARMDGAGEWRIYWSIVMPLARAGLAVAAVFNLVGNWTDFFSPLIYLSDPSKYTLMLGLTAFQDQHGTQWNLMMAASFVVIVPLLAVFVLAQRQFVEGLHLSGTIE